MTTLLAGGTVVRSLHPTVVEVTDLLVVDGRVAAPGTSSEGASRLDCSGCLIVPGNICAHTHLYSTLARGMPYRLPPPRTFLDILRRVWWRLDRALDPASIRASALAGGLEALLAGTTTLVDHHASPMAVDGSLDVVADALDELGIRSVLCYETSDRDGSAVAAAGLAENARFLTSVAAGTRPLARGMVGAHASFTLSRDSLAACAELARRHDVGIHVHAAEAAVDEDDAESRFGVRVAARLLSAGALDERSLLAHGVHLDPIEAQIVRDARATVVHNARSNMNNSVGRAPLDALGERVALGTDGIGADMFEEARAAYLRHREEDVETPITWPLERLTAGARVAAGSFGEPRLGTLLPSAPADVVVLRCPAITPVEVDTLAAHWLFGPGGRSVRDVLVAGEPVIRDGRPVRCDADALAAEARLAAANLWQRLDAINVHPFEALGGA